MKIVFAADYFTGQGNCSVFDDTNELWLALSTFFDGHDKNCAVNFVGQWSGTPQTGMHSNCTCGVIDNTTYHGYVKPLCIHTDIFLPDGTQVSKAEQVFYDYSNDEFYGAEIAKNEQHEQLKMNMYCHK